MRPATARTIDRFPGYFFDESGQVWTCLHKIPVRTVEGKLAGTRTVLSFARPLTHFDRRRKNGRASDYLSVSLGRGQTHYVHRLICEAFHGPSPDPSAVVCHINGDGHDNRPSNLRWGSQADNDADRREHDSWRRGWETRREGHAFSDLLETVDEL